MSKRRIALFSPLPPIPSGISHYSNRQLELLRGSYQITAYAAEKLPSAELQLSGVDYRLAENFEVDNASLPFDLTIYHLGNSPFHDYLTPFLFKYPGLLVLHDAWLLGTRLHQVFANWEGEAFRGEMIEAYGERGESVAEIILSGLHNDTYLKYIPYTERQIRASETTVVHGDWLAEKLRLANPGADVVSIPHLIYLRPPEQGARGRVRQKYGLSEDDILFGTFGYLSEEKRIVELLEAFALVADKLPHARCMLAGGEAEKLQLQHHIERLGLTEKTITTGRLDDAAFLEHMTACDAMVQLRWPTRRETSGVIIAALTFGIPLIISELANQTDIPESAAIAVSMINEASELPRALLSMANDSQLRQQMSTAAREHIAANYGDEQIVRQWQAAIEQTIKSRQNQ